MTIFFARYVHAFVKTSALYITTVCITAIISNVRLHAILYLYNIGNLHYSKPNVIAPNLPSDQISYRHAQFSSPSLKKKLCTYIYTGAKKVTHTWTDDYIHTRREKPALIIGETAPLARKRESRWPDMASRVPVASP